MPSIYRIRVYRYDNPNRTRSRREYMIFYSSKTMSRRVKTLYNVRTSANCVTIWWRFRSKNISTTDGDVSRNPLLCAVSCPYIRTDQDVSGKNYVNNVLQYTCVCYNIPPESAMRVQVRRKVTKTNPRAYIRTVWTKNIVINVNNKKPRKTELTTI